MTPARDATTCTSPTAPRGGPVPAVRGVDLVRRRRRRSLGVAGESGLRQVDAGRDRAAAAPRQRQGRRARSCSTARTCSTMKLGPAARGALGRGRRSSSRARCTRSTRCSAIGQQIAEPILLHEKVTERRPPPSGSRSCSSRSACPPRRAERLPAPALRRAEAAGDDRDGAGLPAPAAHRRRADHRARRHGAGAGPRPAHRRWSRELGVGLLMISHDLSVLGATCDRVAVMYAGRIVEEGPPRRSSATPLHPYSAGARRRRSRPIGDPASRRRADGPARRPAGPGEPADRVPVPPALPDRGRPLHDVDAPVLEPAGAGPRGLRATARVGGEPVNGRTGTPGAGASMTRDLRSSSPRAAATGRRGGRRRRPRGRAAARSSRWSASPAAARRRWPARCSGWCGRPAAAWSTWAGRSATRGRELKAYRRRVQLVLQDPTGALNPRHTVYEAVAEGLRIHGARRRARARGRTALSRAGLRPPERFFLRYPHELSGGQRQRVVIAGALVLEPDGDRRRRAGVLARRLGARRDPGAAAAAARRARAHGAGRHPRPRAGLEHRRPDRGDVPRPDRRDRPDRGRPRATRSTRTPAPCCRWCPRSSRWSRWC